MTTASYGFYLGFGTASAMAGLATFTYDTLTIRADPVFRHAYSWVANDANVIDALGSGIQYGHLRSYRLDSGKFEAVGSASAKWREPRIQMIFDVVAKDPPYRTGLVTCEAVKSTGAFPPRLRTTILKVDYETGDEGSGGEFEGDRTLWLVGDQSAFERKSTRSGLSLKNLAAAVHINKAAAGKAQTNNA